MTRFFNTDINTSAPCIEFTGSKNQQGYGQVQVGDGRPKLAHRVSFAAAHGIPLSDIAGKVVMHLCDNPSCFNPEHLKIGTLQENNADMRIKGRASRTHQPAGVKHGNSKLNDDLVRYIRASYKYRDPDFGAHALSRKLKISVSTISAVTTGRAWKHI